MSTNANRRTTAQIACEAIINHEDDGYSLADMLAVFEVAVEAGVAPFYVGEVEARIMSAVRRARQGVQ